MENLYKELDEVISCIKNSKEYKKCIKLKEEMYKDSNLTKLIDDVKNTQKKYVRSNYDEKVKDTLDKLTDELNNNVLYLMYNDNLNIVNDMINYVKEELNVYFDDLLNK